MNPRGQPASRDFSAIAREQGAARAASEREAIALLIDLVGVICRLRDPDGCPWDRAQSVDSMSLNLQEEAAEAQGAIAYGKDADRSARRGRLSRRDRFVAQRSAG